MSAVQRPSRPPTFSDNHPLQGRPLSAVRKIRIAEKTVGARIGEIGNILLSRHFPATPITGSTNPESTAYVIAIPTVLGTDTTALRKLYAEEAFAKRDSQRDFRRLQILFAINTMCSVTAPSKAQKAARNRG